MNTNPYLSNNFPVWCHPKQLGVAVEQMLWQFSRYCNYTLGTLLRHMNMQVLSNTTHAINQKQPHQQWVKCLMLVIEELKLKINIDTGISGQAAYL